jgi:ABC transporter substrate binding protein
MENRARCPLSNAAGRERAKYIFRARRLSLSKTKMKRRAFADPVAIGLVASLAHPGGNITGLSAESTDTAGKQVELLREVVPGLQRVAILTNADSPGMMAETASVQAAARTTGLEVVTLAIRRSEDITSAFDGLKSRADAVYCVSGPLMHRYFGACGEAADDLRRPELCRGRRASCPMDPTFPAYFGAPPILSTRFSAARSRPISPSRNRPSSCSLSI